MAENRAVRLTDPPLRDAVRRLDEHTRTLARRVGDAARAPDALDRKLMLMEAEVAASLVRSASCEVALRLLPHGISRDAEQDTLERTRSYRLAVVELEATLGPIALA